MHPLEGRGSVGKMLTGGMTVGTPHSASARPQSSDPQREGRAAGGAVDRCRNNSPAPINNGRRGRHIAIIRQLRCDAAPAREDGSKVFLKNGEGADGRPGK